MNHLGGIVAAVVLLMVSTSALSASVESDDIWLRESVPGAENGAGFGTLRNTTSEDIEIVAARSDAAASVEIHRHVHRHGQMAMEKMSALSIAAGETIELRPGDYHLMLMQLHEPLVPDDSFSLVLVLSNGEEIELQAPVKRLLQ